MRGQWHPNATDLLGRIVVFDAPQLRLGELFNNLFKNIGDKLPEKDPIHANKSIDTRLTMSVEEETKQMERNVEGLGPCSY